MSDETIQLLHDTGYCLRPARLVRRLNKGTIIIADENGEYEAEAIVVYRSLRSLRPYNESYVNRSQPDTDLSVTEGASSATEGYPRVGSTDQGEDHEHSSTNGNGSEPVKANQDQGASESRLQPNNHRLPNRRKPRSTVNPVDN